MAIPSTSPLFQTFRIGPTTLSHRIVMAPLTRFRASDSHIPLPFVKDYYAQRASVPGTLLFTEATIVSPLAGGLPHMPGIYSSAQIAAWKEVVDVVHAKGSFIFLQLLAIGRPALVAERKKDDLDVIAPSAIPVSEGYTVPRAMSEDEIWKVIGDFAQGARNAVERAGFDGVEIHAANGHMVDQFTQDVSNQRTDAWGGSVEKRSRFAIEVAKAVSAAVGKERTGIRFSPWGTYLSMRMKDPLSQFSYLMKELSQLGLAHLHLVEPRVSGDVDVETSDSNKPLVEAWNRERPVILAGGYNPDVANKAVQETYADRNVAISFGRYFISNPDLVYRIRKGIAFTPYDRSTFYDAENSKGYMDYKSSQEFFKDYGHV